MTLHSDYCIVRRDILEDENISLESKGVYVFLCSKKSCRGIDDKLIGSLILELSDSGFYEEAADISKLLNEGE